MRIVINTLFLKGKQSELVDYFVINIFNRLARQYPEHEFLFLVSADNNHLGVIDPLIQLLAVTNQPRNVFALNYWYHVKLPMTLHSVKPDLLIQPNGFCSLTTPVPQLVITNELFFGRALSFIGNTLVSLSFKKAKQIVTFSEYHKRVIAKQYKLPFEKIEVIPYVAKEIYQPIGYEVQQDTKSQYADGKEYFLYSVNVSREEEFVNLLKAFSQFKKWQQSNMKLLLVKDNRQAHSEMLEKLNSYKHRSEVVLLNEVPLLQLVNITASAYVVLFPSMGGGLGVSVWEVLQCGTPVIIDETAGIAEGQAWGGLYADAGNPASIAQRMLLLYKDETLRQRLTEEGKLQVKQFSWDKSAYMMWQDLLKVVRQ